MHDIAFIIIGNEILSGKTRDSNLQTLALKLIEKGYEIKEVRIIPDDELTIINTVNELRKKYFLVFTSGGIGPTHDDITTEAIGRAFGVSVEINDEAKNLMANYYREKNLEFNESRKKMAMIPKGATLIHNSISKAPGFKIENVCVLAGIPSIFSAMLNDFFQTLESIGSIYSLELSSTKVTEGMIASGLTAIQNKYKNFVTIGSYPSVFPDGTHNLKLTFEGRNLEKCTECMEESKTLLNSF